jgi:hypothetical protein
MMGRRYVSQDAFERFIAALDDALLLGLGAGYVNERKTAERGSGGSIRENRVPCTGPWPLYPSPPGRTSTSSSLKRATGTFC